MDDASHWADDKLNRKELAEHLSRAVMYQYETYHRSDNAGALCVALDADWGIGKTFFAERWSKDFESRGHPVIRFDAWVNDLADEPLLGFVGVLREHLQLLTARLPQEQRLDAERKLTEMTTVAWRATFSAGKEIAKGLLAHYLRTTPEDLLSAVEDASDGIADEVSEERWDRAADAIVQRAVQAHQDRRSAIDNLKHKLASVLVSLSKGDTFQLPLFVFVDELDRCRPNYAIGLLEGMKHLFDATGVCFIVSTNMDQLGETVKAVYGNGFDGRRYLRRFFSLEYSLPSPTNTAFAAKLASRSGIKKYENSWVLGLPPEALDAKTREQEFAACFALVTYELGLTARDQSQAFKRLEFILANWPEATPCVLSYTIALVALEQLQPGHAAALERNRTDLLPGHKEIKKFKVRAMSGPEDLSLAAILRAYHAFTLLSLDEAWKRIGALEEDKRPRFYELDLATLAGRTTQGGVSSPIPFAQTLRIVATSGLLR